MHGLFIGNRLQTLNRRGSPARRMMLRVLSCLAFGLLGGPSVAGDEAKDARLFLPHLSNGDSARMELVAALGGLSPVIAMAGDLAYVGAGASMAVYDLADPAGPRWIGQSAALPGRPRKARVQGDMLYVLVIDRLRHGRLVALSLAERDAPRRVGIYGSFDCGDVRWDEACDFDLAGDTLYLVRGYAGLSVLDIRHPRRIVEIGQLRDAPTNAASLVPPLLTAVAVQGQVAYVASLDGLRTIDVSMPEQPRQLGLVTGPARGRGQLRIVGGYLLSGYSRYAIVYDISVPRRPVLLDPSISDPWPSSTQLTVRGDRLVIARSCPERRQDGERKLCVTELWQGGAWNWDSDPSTWVRLPFVHGVLQLGGDARRLVAIGSQNADPAAAMELLVLDGPVDVGRADTRVRHAPIRHAASAMSDGRLVAAAFSDGHGPSDLRIMEWRHGRLKLQAELALQQRLRLVGQRQGFVLAQTEDHRLGVIDLRQPDQPSWIELTEAPRTGDYLSWQGQSFSTWWRDQAGEHVTWVDWSQPLAPQETRTIDVPAACPPATQRWVSTWDSRVYLLGALEGATEEKAFSLCVLEVQPDAPPSLLGQFRWGNDFESIRRGWSMAATEDFVLLRSHLYEGRSPFVGHEYRAEITAIAVHDPAKMRVRRSMRRNHPFAAVGWSPVDQLQRFWSIGPVGLSLVEPAILNTRDVDLPPGWVLDPLGGKVLLDLPYAPAIEHFETGAGIWLQGGMMGLGGLVIDLGPRAEPATLAAEVP